MVSMQTVRVLETERLVARWLTAQDAPFILELLNDPDWLRFIGDRNVRTLGDAHEYIRTVPARQYARHGFGLYLVERKPDRVPLGMCGLIRREALPHVDLGFAFLPEHRGLGYALEAAAATLRHARKDFGLERIVAIVQPDNPGSIRLLEKLGMVFERRVQLKPDDVELCLYGLSLTA